MRHSDAHQPVLTGASMQSHLHGPERGSRIELRLRVCLHGHPCMRACACVLLSPMVACMGIRACVRACACVLLTPVFVRCVLLPVREMLRAVLPLPTHGFGGRAAERLVPRLCTPILPISLPHFRLYEVV